MTARYTIVAALLAAALTDTSCRGQAGHAPAANETPALQDSLTRNTHRLTQPTPPAMIPDEEKLHYVAAHWWDGFDFADTTWIADTATMEQVFVDWTWTLRHLAPEEAAPLAALPVTGAKEPPEMMLRFADIAEHYWGDPRSPYHDERWCITLIEHVTASPQIDSLDKIGYACRMEAMRKNLPGTLAGDFRYTTADGRHARLHALRGEYTLLLFYNPGCDVCAETERHIAASETITALRRSGRLKQLAIYPDEDLKAWREHLPRMPEGWIVGHCDMYKEPGTPFHLPLIPSLYLLDRDKRVILKDAPAGDIEEWLRTNANPTAM